MSQLTERIKAKYPQYANVPDDQLEQKVLAKYPQYKPLASKSIGGFLGNVVSSGGKVIGDTVGAAANVFNPDMEKNTIANIAKLGSGIVQLAIPGEQGNEQLARDIGKFYAERYGGVDKAWNTFYNDPVGMVADISTVIGGAGAVAKLGKFGKTAKTLSKVSRATDPMRLPGKAASKVGVKSLDIMGGIKDFGDTYAIKSTRINDRNQAKLSRTMKGMKTEFGDNLESLIDKTGLYGQDLGAVDKYIKPLEDFRDAQIVKSGATAQSGDLLKNFGDKIAELSTPEAMRDPASRVLRQQLIDEANLFAKQNPVRRSNISLDSLNTTRKSLDDNTPNAQFESEKSAFQRSLGNVYRDTVNTSAGTGKAGKELSVLYKFRDMLEKAPKGKNTLPMGITQSIATGTGLLSGGNPLSRVANAAIGYGATSLVNSPKFIGKVSKVAKNVSNYKAPQKISKFLNYGNKAVNTGYNIGKVGRMTPNLDSGQNKRQSLSTQIQPKQPVSYTKSISQPNVFKNKSSFGKVKKLKAGSFN